MRKVNESLIPRLSKLPGFKGYFLMEDDDAVVRSTTVFDTSNESPETSRRPARAELLSVQRDPTALTSQDR